jgi:hypothetical protein
LGTSVAHSSILARSSGSIAVSLGSNETISGQETVSGGPKLDAIQINDLTGVNVEVAKMCKAWVRQSPKTNLASSVIPGKLNLNYICINILTVPNHLAVFPDVVRRLRWGTVRPENGVLLVEILYTSGSFLGMRGMLSYENPINAPNVLDHLLMSPFIVPRLRWCIDYAQSEVYWLYCYLYSNSINVPRPSFPAYLVMFPDTLLSWFLL